MPELKIISTVTELTVTGDDISIKTSYQENVLPDTLEARLATESGIENGTSYIQGEGLIKMKNSPENLNYYLNGNGELILIINSGDGSNYSINSNGELIYTIP